MTWPTKTDFVDGDVLTATQVNNIGTNLNLSDPTSATAGQVLTADGAGSMSFEDGGGNAHTLLSTTDLAGQTTVTVTGISQDYRHLYITVWDIYQPTNPAYIRLCPNFSDLGYDTSAFGHWYKTSGSSVTAFYGDNGYLTTNNNPMRTLSTNSGANIRTNYAIWLYDYATTNYRRAYSLIRTGYQPTDGYVVGQVTGMFNSLGNNPIDEFFVQITTGTFTAGTLKIWGVS